MNGANSSLLSTNSEDDSFVVLGRSIMPENGIIQSTSSNMQRSDSQNLKDSCLSIPNSFPKMPNLNQSNLITSCAMNTSALTSNSELSANEIESKLSAVLQENMYLKEVLNQNNFAIKEQFDKLVKWQEEVMQVHSSHQEKFDETKQFIANLRLENANLKRKLNAYESLEVENSALKNKIELLENKSSGDGSLGSPDQKWNELVDQLSHQLSLVEKARRDELINNQREQENMRSETLSLKEQLLSAQIKLTEFESKKESLKSFHASTIIDTIDKEKEGNHMKRLKENATTYEEHIRNLKRFFDSQKQRQIQLRNSLEAAINVLTSKGPQKEIDTILDRLKKELEDDSDKVIMDQFVTAQNNFHNIFFDLKMLNQELENIHHELDNTLLDLNVSNKQIISYKKDLAASKAEVAELMKLNDELSEQITLLKRELSMKLSAPKVDVQELTKLNEEISVLNNEIKIKDNALQLKSDEMTKLQETVQRLQLENESISILKAQVELYQSDYNAERGIRLELEGERNRLAEDLRLLQRRNNTLINRIESSPESSSQNNPSMNQSSSTPSAPTQNFTSQPSTFICPICNKTFRTLRFLEDHLDQCLPN
ncbi:optineurin isoform X1 [Chrysoperla carnea]|uniref:optineurin isoform X1 n=1 Tax=Chrysoperla carnea TaxID=189513 RepID=UPI001D084BBD|nr:optineurin isoform X1 [Chrysoperla carnea]